MQLHAHGTTTLSAAVGDPRQLTVKLEDAGRGIPNAEIRFECTSAMDAFDFTSGAAPGAVFTDANGYATVQIVPQEIARGRSFQIRARVHGANMPSDVWFTLNVAGDASRAAAAPADGGLEVELPRELIDALRPQQPSPPSVRRVRIVVR